MTLAVLVLVVCIMIFVVVGTRSPSPAPQPFTKAPTKAPTTAGPTAPTTPTVAPSAAPTVQSPFINGTCQCLNGTDPIYSNFPHPLHTAQSFAVVNFLNTNTSDSMTVWMTIQVVADVLMQSQDSRFVAGSQYIYLDALRLDPGQSFSYTLPLNWTANGHWNGARIAVYYRDPAEHDTNRQTNYGGAYPVVNDVNGIVSINGTISNQYRQLVEFTMSRNALDPNISHTMFFYDVSAVDELALPVYAFAGYDTTVVPGSPPGGPGCFKTYIGCRNASETTQGCNTTLIDQFAGASICLSPIKYCANLYKPNDTNSPEFTHWTAICRQWDDNVALGFGITQELLDLYKNCSENMALPECANFSTVPPLDDTPSRVIYGCDGRFLFENHCLANSRDFATRMSGNACAAMNRGVCNESLIDYNYTGAPDQGLSCARFSCDGGVNWCFVPCTEESCFSYLCSNFSLPLLNQTCNSVSCEVNLTNCQDWTAPVAKPEMPGCDSTTMPHYPGIQRQNDYAGWARTKGTHFYGFSLDEQEGGGINACEFSRQLDIVAFPRCGGQN
jgi:hypothetical protein